VTNTRVRLVVVTGLSGSGKTAALKALEDIGFFCVDNLPAALLPKFLQLSVLSGEVVSKVGIGMDSREKSFAERYHEAFEEVAQLGIQIEVLFLDARDEVLVRRFSETRRVHPLAGEGSVSEGIASERTLLKGLRERADVVVDTTGKSVHELKQAVWSYFDRAAQDHKLQIGLESFGFRNGIPHGADMVFDVRFLPNPYFVPELKSQVGTEKAVSDYVFGNETGVELIKRLEHLLEYLIPLFEREGKRYLTVAIGCTGGRHRSVAMVEALASSLQRFGENSIRVIHRDIDK
jgi:UPF0042 nucleotide-binding protein